AECAFGRDNLGVDIDLDMEANPVGRLSREAILFSESHSRFVVTVAPEDDDAFKKILGDRAYYLGLVTGDGRLKIQHQGQMLIDASATELRTAWTNGPAPKALILTGFGINCEEEMAAAYRLAGGEATIVHLNEVLHGRVSIHDFDILNFPGGFSFGDDLGSGVVLANKLRYRQTGADGRTLLADIRHLQRLSGAGEARATAQPGWRFSARSNADPQRQRPLRKPLGAPQGERPDQNAHAVFERPHDV
nr:hypothetical protein [Tanacetum cinerariifolium]